MSLYLDVTLCLPVVEVSEGGQLCWLLHPLDHLWKGAGNITNVRIDELVVDE